MFASQDQDNRRAGDWGLTRNRGGGMARRLRRAAAGAVCAAAVVLSLAGAARAQAATSSSTWTPLTLQNGWSDYGLYSAVTNVSGIVHLSGEIMTTGTNNVAFTLPAGDRPTANVYVPVGMWNATNGRLEITPNGVAYVQTATGNWGNAQTQTSLDGVTFTTSASSFTPLTLQNGWTNFGSGTASPAARNISGIVNLRGAMKTSGTNNVAFTLPAGDRPAADVYVPVDMCSATNGRLQITPSGTVYVEPEGQGASWGNASCFTSLDGVSFATSASSFTPLNLQNGWTSFGPGTASPAARKISGIVYLEGAIKTTGTNPVAFTLPVGDRPAAYFSVKVDLCDATNGYVFIAPSGKVSVVPEGGNWGDASCFTSLDGVSFGR
jgi:hypothetical protein